MPIKPLAPVSVVIPCLNCEGTIDRAVDSLIRQTWQPKEVFLVVDDKSTDKTISKLREIEASLGSSWIKIIELSRGDGPGVARNSGWNATDQRYVAFLDADDAWHPRKVEIQLKYMQDHPEVAITGHRSCWLREREDPPLLDGIYSIRPITVSLMLISNRLVTSTVMLKRDLKFRFEPAKCYSEDYLLWLRIICNHYRADHIDLCMAYSYKPPYGSSGLSRQLWVMEKGELDTYRTLCEEKLISWPNKVTLSAFSLAKYIRRVIILKLRSTIR